MPNEKGGNHDTNHGWGGVMHTIKANQASVGVANVGSNSHYPKGALIEIYETDSENSVETENPLGGVNRHYSKDGVRNLIRGQEIVNVLIEIYEQELHGDTTDRGGGIRHHQE